MATGLVKKLNYKKECVSCDGWGYTNHNVQNTCGSCNGTGIVQIKVTTRTKSNG